MLNVHVQSFGMGAVLADNLCGGVYFAGVGGTAPLGELSPLAAVTLPPAVRDAVGIAQEALYFAFAYPASSAEKLAAAEAAVEAVKAAAEGGAKDESEDEDFTPAKALDWLLARQPGGADAAGTLP